MKVLHCNYSKISHPIFGIKRYEEELFKNISKLSESLEIHRIQRLDNLSRIDNTCFSWVYRYRITDENIVHATYQTLAPIIFFRNPKKFIVSVMDLIPLVYPEIQNDISTRIQWLLTPAALQKADSIVAISEFTKKEIIRLCGVDENKIEVIYLGVDHSKYYPMDSQECKKQFGLNSNDKHILVVASNLPHKRMDLTKKIFDEVRKERSEVKLIKVGYGDLLEGEGIINLGWVREEDMPSLYNAADIFLHTAEYEGFGLPVLEAMACNVPVVVSNCASLPEIVGNCGALVDLTNPEYVMNFSTAILKIVDQGSVKDGLARSKLFNWERNARETYDLYNKIIK
jgi:glycosyltransferase involved in cell wall biosynthesis